MICKKLKRTLAAAAAVAILAGTVASPVMSVCADEVLGETSFNYKAIPWHTYENSPAHQEFTVEDGSFHVKIVYPEGANGEKWDLQVRHRNLDFKKGHKYTVSFKAKAKRAGMQLFSKIGNIKGDQEYFGLITDHMDMGYDMGGSWDEPATLTTEYQEFSGTFTPDRDIENAEWAFHYAKGTATGGNAEEGDEIWFDDMSIFCETCDECGPGSDQGYGVVNRDYSTSMDEKTKEIYKPDGKLVNFISVNQIGYYPDMIKVAVLGDNKGDIQYNASTIDLTENAYKFEVCDAASGDVVYSGTSGKKMRDKDSMDTVCKLDFTEYRTPGRYYIRVGDWRSFEFSIGDNIYSDISHNMLTNAMNYFYQNRSGIDIKEEYITSGDKSNLAHMGGHMTDKASVEKTWNTGSAGGENENTSSKITATGGWYNAGDESKCVINGGFSVWTLQNMYERAIRTEDGKKKFADGSGTVVIPEAGNEIPDVLDEAAYEVDWMTSMVVKEDDPIWGRYAGLVYHKIQDKEWVPLAERPYDWKSARIVKPPTFAATLNYAACSAQAARLWKPYDETKAAKYLDEAKKAYEAYEKYWYEAAEDEETREDSLYAPLNKVKGDKSYGDNEVKDDAYWAACEIFVSAKEMYDDCADKYYKKLYAYNDAFKVTTRLTGGENRDGSLTTLNCGNTVAAGSFTLFLHKDLLSETEAKTVEDSIVAAADEYIKTENEQGYGIPYLDDGDYCDPSPWPVLTISGYKCASNSMVINNAIVMAYAYDQTKESKYISGVTTAMDYLLGTNPLSFSYITGYGTYHEQNPYHRYWIHELDKNFPMAPDGVLSGGPNTALEDPYVRSLGFVPGCDDNPSQRCFVDSAESWATNSAASEWNSPLAWVVSFLQDEVSTASNADPVVKSEVLPKEVIYGDIDLDGTVDLSDLIILSQYLLGDVKELSEDSLNAADCDGNGSVDITDLPRLKQYIMKDKITLGPKKK